MILSEISVETLDRISDKLFLRSAASRSAFWVLLTLAAIIASSGVVADSVATVIGAMIVAPLMTPILGVALALVLAERRRVLTSVAFVLGGAVVVVAVGYLTGLLAPAPVVADTNSQVAARVAPKLIDLVSALASGAVGAFALVRSDVSDTLPGVAIAISLVPPLAVVGLTLQSGAPDQAAGALLLFATNVTAIVATGTAVLLAYRVRATALATGRDVGHLRARTVIVVTSLVVVVAVPLGIGSYQAVRNQTILSTAQLVADRWAQGHAWQVVEVAVRQGTVQVTAGGPAPGPDAPSLRRALDEAGLGGVPARLSEVLGARSTSPRLWHVERTRSVRQPVHVDHLEPEVAEAGEQPVDVGTVDDRPEQRRADAGRRGAPQLREGGQSGFRHPRGHGELVAHSPSPVELPIGARVPSAAHARVTHRG
jgi:uncharacterized hydrophobic protein (TIGR00271 family)